MRVSAIGAPLGEHVIQSIDCGTGCVPLVSIHTYLPMQEYRKADEKSRSSGVESFALQAVEYFINLFHIRLYFLPILALLL